MRAFPKSRKSGGYRSILAFLVKIWSILLRKSDYLEVDENRNLDMGPIQIFFCGWINPSSSGIATRGVLKFTPLNRLELGSWFGSNPGGCPLTWPTAKFNKYRGFKSNLSIPESEIRSWGSREGGIMIANFNLATINYKTGRASTLFMLNTLQKRI